MKLNKPILIFFASILSMLSACQKEKVDIFLPINGADTNWVTTIDASMPVSLLKSDLTIPVHTDSIEVGDTPADLFTSSGIHCSFQANSLTDSNNTSVRGKIALKSILLQKKGDMIRLNTSTSSNASILVSAGMFFINLNKDGKPVKLAPQSKLKVQYSDSLYIPFTKIFYGTGAGQGIWNWYLNTDPNNTIEHSAEGYEVNTNRLGWINTGYVADSNNLQSVRINISLAPHFTNANTIAWLVFKSQRSVINLNADTINKEFSIPGIPVDKEVTILVLSRQVDDYYIGSKDIITSTGGGTLLTVPLSPVKTSLDAMLQYLNSL